MTGYERLVPTPGSSTWARCTAADQRRTSGLAVLAVRGVYAARRVRLVADGGGLENRYGA